MKREALIAAALAALGLPARSTLIVHDPALAVQHQTNHVVDFVKWAQTEAHEAKIQLDAAQTQINTLNTYRNTVTQLIRMGDPSQIRNLPGVRDVADLASSGQQLYQSYARLPQYFDPSQYQRDANGVLNSFQRPSWNGWTAPGGVYVPSTPWLYQFDTARWNSANQVQQWLDDIERDRQRLQAQRDQLTRLHDSATDAASQAKYAAQLANVNAALDQLDARAQQAVERGKIQQQKIAAGQAISESALREQAAALHLRQADTAFGNFPGGGVRQTVRWNP